MREFLLWEPFIPTGRRGKIDLKGFADLLAPLTRMLRDDVTDALKDPESPLVHSPLVHLARDGRKVLLTKNTSIYQSEPQRPTQKLASQLNHDHYI